MECEKNQKREAQLAVGLFTSDDVRRSHSALATESINFKFFHCHALAGDSWTALGEKFTHSIYTEKLKKQQRGENPQAKH
jgi:hypothetical protein